MKKPFGHIGRVISLLTPGERKRLGLVVLGAIFMALIEVIGVGSIMPFMAVAAKPEIIHSNEFLKMAYVFLGFNSDTSFLIFLGVAVLLFLIITNVSQALMHYIKVKFTSMRRHSLSQRLLEGYLGQPYTFFLNRNSFEFVKNINGEINQMITGTLMQFVDLISRCLQVFILTAFLFIMNPLSTLGITGIIALIYGTIYFFVRKVIRRLGEERFTLTRSVAKTVSEAFWGIKEVKITGTESVFLDEYQRPSKKLALNASTHEIIGDVPKFALETAAFSSIMLFVLVTILRSGTFADVAGTVTLYAYAGYRMIPAIQGLFKAVTKLKYGAPTAERIITEFKIVAGAEPISRKPMERLPFYSNIELRNLSFTYPNVETPVIEGLSLTIQANSLVGFAGKTGSGKTTLVDIILGLLSPQKGDMLVDSMAVTKENLRSWHGNLGYVPQNIYLSNTSVAANIAFGIHQHKIDMEAVQQAAKRAQIHDFIISELKEGYETKIGERGIRLSGGQRQRLGIARALYRNPSVLVMDEATSALDNHTEQAVMEAIDALHGTRTIILIAHRLSTLAKCDKIYQLERGKIVDSGTYEELVEKNQYFRKQETKDH